MRRETCTVEGEERRGDSQPGAPPEATTQTLSQLRWRSLPSGARHSASASMQAALAWRRPV